MTNGAEIRKWKKASVAEYVRDLALLAILFPWFLLFVILTGLTEAVSSEKTMIMLTDFFVMSVSVVFYLGVSLFAYYATIWFLG